MSISRFLYCENVNLADPNRPTYILQTTKHRMLIEIVPYNDEEDLNYSLNDVFDLFKYNNPDGFIEKYMLRVVQFQDLKEDEIDENMAKIRKHIIRAWNWYKNYLIKSDAQIDSEYGQDFPGLN